MKDLQGYIVLKDLPSADFGNGKLLDESAPAAADGSAVTVQTHNDYYYAHHAPIKKYLPSGDVSDTDESDTDSDARDAAEYMAGIKVDTVDEWDILVGYSLDESVIYRGIQFVSMTAGNLGNDPFTNPDKWLPCHEKNDAFMKWQRGEDIRGGFDILHNYRDAGYRQLFSWGKYNTGGATLAGGGGSGINYEAFGVHLDGTVITGDATLEAIFDVGGAGEYHLLDVIAPDVVGTRTLLNARGRVGMVVDSIAGKREDVGVVQADQLQGFEISGGVTAVVVQSGSGTSATALTFSGTSQSFDNHVGNQGLANDGVNGAPRIGDETRPQNYSVGVPSILVINEV